MDQIAVLIPCYNEEKTISSVIQDFAKALPQARIYVYDNNSTDRTVELALLAGAIVRNESMQGKGQVVRRMFADIDAEIYLLVDGDATYDASFALSMIQQLCEESLDMVVAARKIDHANAQGAYPIGHEFGNRLFTGIVHLLFGKKFEDMLSGYRVFSRRFVKSYPALSRGFEIETEMTIHAQELRLPASEIETPYFARPEGSLSKLSTFKDGARISATILLLVKEYKPVLFFGVGFVFLTLISLIFGVPVIRDYFATGLVPRFPSAILAASLMVLASLSLACGFILDSVARGRREMKRLSYLSFAAPRPLSLTKKTIAAPKQEHTIATRPEGEFSELD